MSRLEAGYSFLYFYFFAVLFFSGIPIIAGVVKSPKLAVVHVVTY